MSTIRLSATLAVAAFLSACAGRYELPGAVVPTTACPVLVAALAAAADTTALLAVVAEEVNSHFSEPAPSSFTEFKRATAHALGVKVATVAQFLDPERHSISRAIMPICEGPSRTKWRTPPPRMPGDTLMVAMSRPHLIGDTAAIVFIEVTEYYRTPVVTLADGPAGQGRLYRVALRNGQWVVTRMVAVRAQLRL